MRTKKRRTDMEHNQFKKMKLIVTAKIGTNNTANAYWIKEKIEALCPAQPLKIIIWNKSDKPKKKAKR